MGPFTDRRHNGNSSAVAFLAFAALSGCDGLPGKSAALEIIQRDVREEAQCVLPVALLGQLKVQHATRGICVPQNAPGSTAADAAIACVGQLVASGITQPMPASYMAEWPDEVSSAAFDVISPYERKARALLFKSCVEMRELRAGRFRCGEARADKVVRVSKKDDDHAVVRYARAITLDPQLASIEAACGAVTRPAPEATVTLAKTDKTWTLVHEPANESP